MGIVANRSVRLACRVWLCLAVCLTPLNQPAYSGEVDQEAAYAQAFEFMRTYYQQVNLEKALEQTTGDAQQVVSKEIQGRKEAGVSRDAVPPSADFKRHTVKKVGGDFVMTWSVLSGADLSLNVTTRSVRTDGGWRVSSFRETEDK